MEMMISGRGRFPFTASQWQELEHQALVFNYMVSGIPIPPDLIFTVRRSFDSYLSSKLLLHQPQLGWNGFQMGFGRKIDPEPGRCRRTDGKKWRCSKDAYLDSKYCERHMHRGRNRSRKPVEILSPTEKSAIPINKSSITKTTLSSPSESRFLYPHFPSTRSSGIGLSSSQENTTRNSHGYGHEHGMKGESGHYEHPYFSDISSNSVNDSSWQLAPLTMGFPLKDKAYNSSCLENGLQHNHEHHHHYNSDINPLNIERDDDQPKKVMHHFLDEWPPKDPISEDKLSISNRTQLSISITNSLHDFFMTPK